jgi:6-phosphogluconolactonase
MLATAAAARFLTALLDAQAERGSASAVLTGGGTGIAMLERVRSSAFRDAVDWRRVDLYWGDERFLPAGHADRNETQARAALLDHLPVESARVHPMPAGDEPDAVDEAAAAYARLLAEHAVSGDPAVPAFDVCLLGVGEEGHTASIFPYSPAVRADDRAVVGVRDCPKPPPRRVSLTLGAIRRSRQVWLLTSGESKAVAVASALGDAPEENVPAAGARGTEATLWLLDRAAAGQSDPPPGVVG